MQQKEAEINQNLVFHEENIISKDGWEDMAAGASDNQSMVSERDNSLNLSQNNELKIISKEIIASATGDKSNSSQKKKEESKVKIDLGYQFDIIEEKELIRNEQSNEDKHLN